MTLAAVASEPHEVRTSQELLTKVEDELEAGGNVQIVGNGLTGLRQELTNEQVWRYGKELGVQSSVVLQYRPNKQQSASLLVWASETERGPARKPILIESFGDSGIQPLQLARVAAVIEQVASRARVVAVELHIRTKPARTYFRVGSSDPELTDDKGRYVWVGTLPRGPVTVQAYNDPEYEPTAKTIEVEPTEDGSLFRDLLPFELRRKSNKKTPN